MHTSPVKAYVTQADGDFVKVKVLDAGMRNGLLDLGFSPGADVDEYRISSSNDSIKAAIFSQLRQLDVCFSSGREWCPAEVFHYLRDIGVLSDGFKRISWIGPGHYWVTDEQ